jgi:hypothetical protein
LGQFSTSLVFTPIINAAGYRSGYIIAAGVIILTGLAALLIEKKPEIAKEAEG